MAQNQGQDQGQRVVGPNIQGKREAYQLQKKLQQGLFGGVYEAKGATSKKLFAVKVLIQAEIAKTKQVDTIEFCEVPLSEIQYLKQMSDCEYLNEVKDHFQDDYCHYIVFDLAPGGDLLEALKMRPTGFDENEAQFLIGQATKGLSVLHARRLAMQDVSLENMLISYLEDGQYQIKICDPGQATEFEVDRYGEEIPVQFTGFVGKSFRPPELLQRTPYLASKVDAWCLGWSTFYLLAAQPLFLSADPKEQDVDWAMFQKREVKELFHQKSAKCTPKCMEFIQKLMHLDPRRRLSVSEALRHDWLKDPNVRPMYLHRSPQATYSSPVRTSGAGFGSGSIVTQGGSGGSPTQQGSSQSVQAANGRNNVALSPEGARAATNGRTSAALSPDGGRAGRFRNPQPNGRAVVPTAATNASVRAPSRGQAPSWKMTPISRSESPSPGPGTSASATSALGFRQQQHQAPRHASPFGTLGHRDEANARQLATPRQPEAAERGTTTVTPPAVPRALPNFRSMALGGSAALNPSTVNHEPVVNLGARNGQYSQPTPTNTANGSDGGNSPTGMGSSDVITNGHGSSGANVAAVASRTTSGTSSRHRQLSGLGEAGHGSSATGVPGSSPLTTGVSAVHRTNSPIPQAQQILIRPGTTNRGYSPGPLGTLGQTQQRTGSPMQQHSSSGVPAAISATRGSAVIDAGAGGAARGSAVIDAGSGGHYWQSPRAGSPSTVVRPSEAFARGRSTTRASSPSQVVGHSPTPSPTPVMNTYPASPQVMRGVSPSVLASVPGRNGTSGAITWNPNPLSPMTNKRSVSPVHSPAPTVLTSRPKWVA